MYCWGGIFVEMYQFLDFGFYISFSGIVIFFKVEFIYDCVCQVLEDCFLVEIDCFFLVFVFCWGKCNELVFVVFVVMWVVEFCGVDFDSVVCSSIVNVWCLFGFF